MNTLSVAFAIQIRVDDGMFPNLHEEKPSNPDFIA